MEKEKKEKTLEDACFEFQQSIADAFNNEQGIPFLLKYYLMKEVWDSVQKNKMKVDMEVRANHPPKSETMVIGEIDES